MAGSICLSFFKKKKTFQTRAVLSAQCEICHRRNCRTLTARLPITKMSVKQLTKEKNILFSFVHSFVSLGVGVAFASQQRRVSLCASRTGQEDALIARRSFSVFLRLRQRSKSIRTLARRRQTSKFSEATRKRKLTVCCEIVSVDGAVAIAKAKEHSVAAATTTSLQAAPIQTTKIDVFFSSSRC